ncbi:MAG: hypothetical protein IJU11_04255 [Prevotella sp.]|nr:hypothetical protein [Prevotella sp.]
MKKTYQIPALEVVAFKSNGNLLLSYSNTEAANDATVLGRESADFDEE